MFDLVADVASYPEFVPLCSDMRIRSRTTRPDGKDVLVAVMTIELGWALLDPDLPAPWLQRSVVAMICLSVLSIAYGSARLTLFEHQ